MMFSFYFGVYSGTMLGHWSRSCLRMSAPLLLAGLRAGRGTVGTFTPFASTLLIDKTGDKASPATG